MPPPNQSPHPDDDVNPYEGALMIATYLRGSIRSWTMWVNSVALTLVLAAPQAQEFLPIIKPYLTQESFSRLTIVVLVLNLVLRIKTKQPLSAK